MDGLNAMKSTF